MTAPQFPAGWGQPAPAQQPAPQFGQPAPQFGQAAAPAQAPQQIPGYAYPPAPPVQYAPNPYAQQQQYAPAPAQPEFTPAGGSLDDYLGQRSSGAKFWKWPAQGHVNVGMVPRDLRDTDVRQVSFQGQPVRRKDGSISTEKALYLPLVDAQGDEWVWEVKGRNRDALTQACQAAGSANGLPEKGGMLRVTMTGSENVPGTGVARKVLHVEYVRPNGAPAPQPAPQQAAPAPQAAPIPQPGPVTGPPPQQFPAPQAPVPAPVPQAAPAAPAGQAPQLSPEAAAQFANMLGAAAPQQQQQ